MAAMAFSSQDQPAEYRDILPPGNQMPAVRAAASRRHQVEFRLLLFELRRVRREILKKITSVFILHHDRQTVDDNIEEAADKKS